MNDAAHIPSLLVTLTADITAAHVSYNYVDPEELPILITEIHNALSGLNKPMSVPAEEQEPAISIKASVKPDYIICLEDGKKMKMLKRHIQKKFGMTPAQYRQKWHLPSDYPMVAPNYAAERKALALKNGLGHHSGVGRGHKKDFQVDMNS